MHTSEKVLGWFMAVFGGFAVLGSLDPFDVYGVVGGALFTTAGIVILNLVNKLKA